MTPDNYTIAAICGLATFLLMLVIKIPVKIITRKIAETRDGSDYDRRVLNKRLNLIIIVLTFLLGFILFWESNNLLKIEHFSMSHAIEAGAFAIAYYALFERFFKVSET